jgi:hypothetical protein
MMMATPSADCRLGSDGAAPIPGQDLLYPDLRLPAKASILSKSLQISACARMSRSDYGAGTLPVAEIRLSHASCAGAGTG